MLLFFRKKVTKNLVALKTRLRIQAIVLHRVCLRAYTFFKSISFQKSFTNRNMFGTWNCHRITRTI